MFKRGDLANGKPQEGGSVTYDTYRRYVKAQHLKLKKEMAAPKIVGPRNFAEEQIRKDVEAKASGYFTREVFKPGSSGEPSEGL